MWKVSRALKQLFIRIWKDPVLSKVIAAGIIALLGLLWFSIDLTNRPTPKDIRTTEEPSKNIEPQIVHPLKENKANQTKTSSVIERKTPQSKPPTKDGISEGRQLAVTRHTIVPKTNKRLDELKSLINKVYSDATMINVAVIIDSGQIKSSFSPQSKLYNLLRTDKVNIIENLFQEKKFIDNGFFREIYEGNIEILKQSGALRGIDYLLLGKIDSSFKTIGLVDNDLISCDINFSYKLIGQNGDMVNSDNIRVISSGFSEDAAFERGLEMLVEQNSNKIFKKI